MGASVTSAATPAATPAADPVNLVNAEVAVPAAERYPGPVDATQYLESSGPRPAGDPGGPPYGSWGAEPFTATLPESAPGGGFQDTAWMTGHDAPEVAWDSSAGEPFAPSGAVDPLLHAEDTGGVWVKQNVVPAEIGQLTRRTMTGQTTVRNGSGDQVTKDNVTSPNGRADLDQQQWHDPDGYNPWEIPYSERAITNNLAWESVPTSAEGAPYGVAGDLPDRSPYLDYAAVAYMAPPDPAVSTTTGATTSGTGAATW
jgi:hypothetical protein